MTNLDEEHPLKNISYIHCIIAKENQTIGRDHGHFENKIWQYDRIDFDYKFRPDDEMIDRMRRGAWLALRPGQLSSRNSRLRVCTKTTFCII